MIGKFRQANAIGLPHSPPGAMKTCICVRKRPISYKEIDRKEYDSVTCLNPVVTVHYCKMKVDGISKYLENVDFEVGKLIWLLMRSLYWLDDCCTVV